MRTAKLGPLIFETSRIPLMCPRHDIGSHLGPYIRAIGSPEFVLLMSKAFRWDARQAVEFDGVDWETLLGALKHPGSVCGHFWVGVGVWGVSCRGSSYPTQEISAARRGGKSQGSGLGEAVLALPWGLKQWHKIVVPSC